MSDLFSSVVARRVGLCATVAVLALVGGCGESAGPSGKVTGKVTYQGQAVSSGMVSFAGEEIGVGGGGLLQEDGSYELLNVAGGAIPVGAYKVAIRPVPPKLPNGDMEAMEERMKNSSPWPKIPNIPAKYRNVQTSGFSAEVKEGDNTFDFEMTEE